MSVGFGKWAVGKVLKEGPDVIKSVKPLKKIKGALTKGQVMSKAALAKMKTAVFNLEQTFKQTDKVLKKFGKTVEKQKKILDK